MNDQPPETHHLRHELCGGSVRLWRCLENTGPQGLVKVQGYRNGDEYHKVMEDLALDFFLNHKTIDCIGIVSSVPDATNIMKPEVAHYYLLTVL